VRILVASDFYPPFVGGAEKQVQLLAAALSARGHNVRVVTVWHEGLPEVELDGRVPVHRLRSSLLEHRLFSTDPVRRFHPPFPTPGIVGSLRSLIREHRPDVVNANGWIAYSCAAAMAASSIPLVLSVRDYGYSCAVRTLMQYERQLCSGPGFKKCMRCAQKRYGSAKAVAAVVGVVGDRPLLRGRVHGIHVVSEYTRSIVKRDLIRSNDSAWQPPVVRIPDIPPSQSGSSNGSTTATAVGLPEDPFILFVGQLTRHKGVYTLLSAYERLEYRPPLVMIGTNWPDTPKLLPPGVLNLGEQPHEIVLRAWRRALFGVVPSIWPDPLPGVVREAMSQGIPVVGSATGGIPDMIEDGTTGLLVQPGDVADLRAAMARLVADADLRSHLGAAARHATEAITASSVASEFEQLYHSAKASAATKTRSG
jgi:glycosyltransferase involved in cell wall biosynthesis